MFAAATCARHFGSQQQQPHLPADAAAAPATGSGTPATAAALVSAHDDTPIAALAALFSAVSSPKQLQQYLAENDLPAIPGLSAAEAQMINCSRLEALQEATAAPHPPLLPPAVRLKS